MRTLLVALMMVLLPLRGWMGDAMAISMMTMPIGAVIGAQAHGMAQTAVQPSEHEDCAGMQMAAAAPHESGQNQGAMAGCESCSVCQACSSVAMGVDAIRTASLSLAQASPMGSQPHFASAPLQRGQKTPIS